jgi:hypothetical protein
MRLALRAVVPQQVCQHFATLRSPRAGQVDQQRLGFARAKIRDRLVIPKQSQTAQGVYFQLIAHNPILSIFRQDVWL